MKLTDAQRHLLKAMAHFPTVRIWLIEKPTMEALERRGLTYHIVSDDQWGVTEEGHQVLAALRDA